MSFIDKIKTWIKEYEEKAPERDLAKAERLKRQVLIEQEELKLAQIRSKKRKVQSENKPKHKEELPQLKF